MRLAHLYFGVAGVIAFVITGQVMAHHVPNIRALPGDVRMMFVSRHIYLLGAALVNLVLGLYLRLQTAGWRRGMQRIGSLLILVSVVVLLMAFISEPALGLAGRGWRTFLGMITLFAGVMTHLVASFWAEA